MEYKKRGIGIEQMLIGVVLFFLILLAGFTQKEDRKEEKSFSADPFEARETTEAMKQETQPEEKTELLEKKTEKIAAKVLKQQKKTEEGSEETGEEGMTEKERIPAEKTKEQTETESISIRRWHRSEENIGTAEERESEKEEIVSIKEKETEELKPIQLHYAGGLQSVYGTGSEQVDFSQVELYVVYDDGTMLRLEDGSYRTEGFQTEKSGSYQCKFVYEDLSAEVFYEVAAFSVTLYLNGGHIDGKQGTSIWMNGQTIQEPEVVPKKSGHQFAGWYLDESLKEPCVFPIYASDICTRLYAKWSELSSPYVILGGKLMEYSGKEEDLDGGMLELPKEVKVITSNAFRWNTSPIEELILGSEVAVIEPGAFLGMSKLLFLDVNWKNTYFKSIDCGLYTADERKLAAYPQARTGTCKVSAKTEVIGSYVFYESHLSKILLPAALKKIESNNFGEYLKILRFHGMTPPEIQRDAFHRISKDLVIEVPAQAAAAYRESLADIDPGLAQAVIPYQ